MSALLRRFAALSRQQQVISVLVGVVALALVGVVVAVAVGGDGSGDRAAPTTTQPRPTTTAAVTTTTQPATGPVAPLTGLRVQDPLGLLRPALAVKIDNLDTARETAVPQTGLNQADVVFEEIVEGDITRLVGVFHSQTPDPIGPVRSLRTTDIHLLPQLSHPLVAFSGGNAGVLAAAATADLTDRSANAVPGAYFRERSRRAPHNLYVHPQQLWADAPPEARVPTPIFSYLADGEQRPAGALPARGVDLTWGGGAASSPVGWRWDAATKLYLRTQRGEPQLDAGDDRQLNAANVVVLATPYGQSPADTRSPEALTVGSGEAWVLSGGVVVHGTWNRPNDQSAASLTDDAGAAIELTPGRTWIELPRADGVTIVS